ncbi:MAG TPA: cytochrome c [Steroidobacteraceae bacterium]
MVRRGRKFLLAMALVAAALSGCTQVHGDGHENLQNFDLIQRGRYLVTLGDCTACHADPSRSDSPFGGGRAVATPFGSVVAPNISPDRQTGIGNWTGQQFDDAVRRGRRADGKRLYPAMPFPYFARMSAADVGAMWAYLNSLKPVHHAVVADRLPFPFSIRATMIFWDWLYYRRSAWRPAPGKSAAWNRGSYIVTGPGHCGACHTPKTFLGGDERSHVLQGYSLDGWFAPDLTGDPARGLAAWNSADIVGYLRTGHNRFEAASGPMAEEVKDSSSAMSAQDLAAIATYLKGQESTSEQLVALPPDNPLMVAGAAIYRDTCSGCHKIDGSGVPYLIPNLAGSAAVASREPTTLLRVILHGAASAATPEEPTAPQMPSYAWQLDDIQVAAVATYVRNSWGHAAGAVPEAAARAARDSSSTTSR